MLTHGLLSDEILVSEAIASESQRYFARVASHKKSKEAASVLLQYLRERFEATKVNYDAQKRSFIVRLMRSAIFNMKHEEIDQEVLKEALM